MRAQASWGFGMCRRLALYHAHCVLGLWPKPGLDTVIHLIHGWESQVMTPSGSAGERNTSPSMRKGNALCSQATAEEAAPTTSRHTTAPPPHHQGSYVHLCTPPTGVQGARAQARADPSYLSLLVCQYYTEATGAGSGAHPPPPSYRLLPITLNMPQGPSHRPQGPGNQGLLP